ncbi:MAG: MBL fold metallo-hydrolase [Deltaproteobacteria bacterium]|nr:MBL fold metallo-hydrolase [Deltaproteobacteria bacterium]
MRVKFWGVRGSIPCPGPNTVQYGGNTPCIELRFHNPERLIIVDAGSGIRELGNAMMIHDFPKGPIQTEIFLTHTHWDHIMGFPFFTPIYIPGTHLKVYGPVSYEQDSLEKVVGGQLSYRYFPVRHIELAARIEYFDLKEGDLELGDGISLTTKYLNHPVLCLGYRFEFENKSICTVYDTEPFRNLFCMDTGSPSYNEEMSLEGEQVAKEQNEAIEQFMFGADLVIYDSQYTQGEYELGKIGWGHSPIEHVCMVADRAKVKRMALFHHEPMRTDEQMKELERIHCREGNHDHAEIFFARERMEIDL